MTQQIAVLYGGWSAEREVSLRSGEAVISALRSRGHSVTGIDVTPSVAAALENADTRPDVVFNALHGRYGEDGTIQGMLDVLGIPYTHSGVLASALAMDKAKAKVMFAAAGLPCAQSVMTSYASLAESEPMPRPFVVKPANEGSSVGVVIVREGDALPTVEDMSAAIMVERYIAGREIQVAVLGDETLGAIEITTKNSFYDYEAKYTDGAAEHLMPAPLPKAAYDEVCAMALIAHQALGCRGLTRSDFRYSDPEQGGDGLFYILETNTQPGMTPISLSPEIAAHAGIDFAELCERLVTMAKVGA